ncbi:MAG: dockerin type I repeat-containing protein, partial [Clostridia bacterium]|nr:dockerin type I repeat-containing protein [Clostridia bacterium]
TWRFINVGKYRIQIRFKSGMNKSNGGKVDNVKWSDNSRSAYQVTLTIEKLVLTADGWIDGEGTDVPTLDSEDLDEIEKYFDYVLKTQAGEVIDIDTPLEEGKYYTIALKVKPEYAGNVFINYKGQEVSETAPYAFQTKEEFFEPTDFIPTPSDEELTIKYKYTGEEITFELGDWYDEDKMTIVSGEMKGTEIGEYHVVVGFNEFANTVAWGTEEKWSRNPVTVTFVICEEENTEKGRFVLIDEMKDNHPFKFQYEDYKVYDNDISEYVYSESDVVYMARLAFNDTLADLLAQFKNGNEIKVFDAKDVEITNMSQVLATGIVLRLMDGTTVLNQLTISVLGDIDGDGKIGTLDKAQLNAYTLGTRKLEGAKLLACDIDGDSKIGTLDKAQLNAYTLGTRDLYSKLTLKSSAKSASVASIASEEVIVNSEEVMSEVTVEENTVRIIETDEIETVVEIIEIAVKASEEANENYEEKSNNSSKKVSIILVDTRRETVSF